jgi:hypothetical protein
MRGSRRKNKTWRNNRRNLKRSYLKRRYKAKRLNRLRSTIITKMMR